jgi:Flp pilus assembly pilin Flp
MLWRIFRDQSGVSSVEFGLYLACLGVWCVIGLETIGALPLHP